MNRLCTLHLRNMVVVAPLECDACRAWGQWVELRGALKACRRQLEVETRGTRFKRICDLTDELLERTGR